mgnify:CR=1 FL=1
MKTFGTQLSKSLFVVFIKGYGIKQKKYITDKKNKLILQQNPHIRVLGQVGVLCPQVNWNTCIQSTEIQPFKSPPKNETKF